MHLQSWRSCDCSMQILRSSFQDRFRPITWGQNHSILSSSISNTFWYRESANKILLILLWKHNSERYTIHRRYTQRSITTVIDSVNQELIIARITNYYIKNTLFKMTFIEKFYSFWINSFWKKYNTITDIFNQIW
jgi:hypothetical protein